MKAKENATMRGIVHSNIGQEKFKLSRFEPVKSLKPFIEHFWTIQFDLSAMPPYTQTVLSYPNVHLAFEQDEKGRRALIYGIPERPFERTLHGKGRVLGIKFCAGGFYPFWKRKVSLLTGKTLLASKVFGSGINKLTDTILEASSDKAMAKHAEHMLLEYLPDRHGQAEQAARIIQDVMNDRSITKVEHISEHTGLPIRQLQRLFNKYIGVSPKWVIKRFRIQEAAETLEQNESVQLAELALQLGYFDQAHFIKDFKTVIGQSPLAYMKSAEGR